MSGINRRRSLSKQRKAFPWGVCPAQRIQNLYDCQWQSYLYYGGPAQAGPDEVEGSNFVPTYGDHRSLRPHQSQLTLRQRSSGMTATGSHIDFGFAARSTTLQGKALLCTISHSVDFYCFGIKSQWAGHAAAPTMPRRQRGPLRPCKNQAGGEKIPPAGFSLCTGRFLTSESPGCG